MQTAITDTVVIPRQVMTGLGVIWASNLDIADQLAFTQHTLGQYYSWPQTNGAAGRAANAGTGTEPGKRLTFDYILGCVPESGISKTALTSLLAGNKHGFDETLAARTIGRMEKAGKFTIRDGLYFRPQQTQQGAGVTGSTTTQAQETRTPALA